MSSVTIECKNPGCRRKFIANVTYVYGVKDRKHSPNVRAETCPHCGYCTVVIVQPPAHTPTRAHR